jgi:RNA polymerase sigma factor (sigma-70 family)
MVASQPWIHLQEGFLEAVRERGARPLDWHAMWALIVADTWYQEQLAACARSLVARQNARGDWLEDVQQEAMTLLGRHLRKWPDLRVNPDRPHTEFAGWMRGIIRNTCQEALRQVWRKRRPLCELPEDDIPDRRGLPIPRRVELSLAIDEIAEPAKTVLTLRFKGFNCKEIARRLHLSYEETRCALATALATLRSTMRREA